MSLRAMDWAISLPTSRRDEISDQAHLTLIALTDHGDRQGRGCFPSAATLASIRSVSIRTIRRHLAQLEDAGLIERGDQRLVNHIDQDRRPVVWDMTLITDEPVDNSVPPPVSGVTPLFDRGDTKGGDGVTPGVTQSPITITSNSYVPNSPRPAELSTGDKFDDCIVTATAHDETAGECIHGFSAGVHEMRNGKREPWCPFCRRLGCITSRPMETTNV